MSETGVAIGPILDALVYGDFFFFVGVLCLLKRATCTCRCEINEFQSFSKAEDSGAQIPELVRKKKTTTHDDNPSAEGWA